MKLSTLGGKCFLHKVWTESPQFFSMGDVSFGGGTKGICNGPIAFSYVVVVG